MSENWNRRRVLKRLAAVSASLAWPRRIVALTSGDDERATDFEARIARVSDHTVRWTVLPIHDGNPVQVQLNGSLVQPALESAVTVLRRNSPSRTIDVGQMKIHASFDPLSMTISSASGKEIQTLSVDRTNGVVSFATGNSPLLGLGEGGHQFDRRGSVDSMVSGQGGYKLETHGGRVPIPWIIGTQGWALFFHQPYGTFDLTGSVSKFIPKNSKANFPLDLFFVASSDPGTILREYVRLTGHPELPALWTLGYQQSHRTLANREEILREAKTFSEKRLPCDTMIYLGTG